MKRVLLTRIAVLLLTGAAHAGRYHNWKCGDVSLQTSYEPAFTG
jgi:hypothetical protein